MNIVVPHFVQWFFVNMFITSAICFLLQKVSVWKKLYMIYDFFIARRIVGTFFTLFFFGVLIPMIIIFPEAQISVWELIYIIPTAIILLNSVGIPRLDQCLLRWVFVASTTSNQVYFMFQTRKISWMQGVQDAICKRYTRWIPVMLQVYPSDYTVDLIRECNGAA